ncbi:hypothetical protein H2198_010084 [Neophaeococcomyces mojaviensis]|uniref:Uncharacterized protein n=1 Tax=Neophaeococcomyces mojaviensis TaxID=3383035 RepID=A0ACC2ZSR7_9EURO|nr:hypothetical protein H2198_010084 [Knufia sp. JES_112]
MPSVKVTKALQKRSDQALESFHKYYASIWTEERWHNTLFPALSQPTRYCALLNQYVNSEDVLRALQGSENSSEDIADFNLPQLGATGESSTSKAALCGLMVKQKSSEKPFPTPIQIELAVTGTRLSHWNMDGASVLAAHMLQVRSTDQVLDLCAAPGGKSLVLAQTLWPSLHASRELESKQDVQNFESRLHSNESDLSRNKRLAANLQSYLPSQLIDTKAVQIIRIDGTEKSAVDELPLGKSGYDKVLVDAPCSSERHIIHAYLKAASSGQIAEEMANWKPSHSKTIAKTQAALLITALKSVKIGGTVVYATCSISSEENDDVIERTIETTRKERKRNPDSTQHAWKIEFDTRFEDDESSKAILDSMTEKTKYGRIALPDHAAGGKWGPLYFCVMQKMPYKSKKTELRG